MIYDENLKEFAASFFFFFNILVVVLYLERFVYTKLLPAQLNQFRLILIC